MKRIAGVATALIMVAGPGIVGVPAPSVAAAAPVQNGRIAFSNGQIYTVNPDGSGLRQVTNLSGPAENPSWNTFGTMIAFDSVATVIDPSTQQPTHVSHVFDVFGNGLGQVIDHTPYALDNLTQPAMSHGGGMYAYRDTDDAGYSSIHISLLCKELRNCTDRTLVPVGSFGDSSSRPSWAPGDLAIAFSSYRYIDSTIGYRTDVYRINLDGTGWQRLTDDGGREPAWSPDGTKIAYSRSATPSGPGGIWMMNSNGSNQHVILANGSHGVDELTGAPTWSPDGRFIAYVHQQQSGGHSIWVMNADGSNAHQIAIAPSDNWNAPSWGRKPDLEAIHCPKPVLKGTARVGGRLRVVQGVTTPTRVREYYRWLRGSKPIRGVITKTYKLKRADGGKRIRVRVSCRAPGLTTVTVTSKARLVHR